MGRYHFFAIFALLFFTSAFILFPFTDVVKHHNVLSSVVIIETVIWIFHFVGVSLTAMVIQTFYDERMEGRDIPKDSGDKIRDVVFNSYRKKVVRYVSSVVVEVAILIIATMLVVYLGRSGTYLLNDEKKPYKSSYDIYIFAVFICLGGYSVSMMLLIESGSAFVIIMGISIELCVHIGYQINEQYHYTFFSAIVFSCLLILIKAGVHSWYENQHEQNKPTGDPSKKPEKEQKPGGENQPGGGGENQPGGGGEIQPGGGGENQPGGGGEIQPGGQAV